MPIISNTIMSERGVVRSRLAVVAAFFLIVPGLAAQDKDAPRPEKGAASKIDKQKGRSGKGSATPSTDDSRRRNGEPDTPALSPVGPDEATVAAQRAIAALNAAIKKAEASGRDVADLKTHAAELNTRLLNREKSASQIATEASAATLQAVEQLPDSPPAPAEPARTASGSRQRKADPGAEERQETDAPQSGTPQPFPLWFSIGALAVSVLALVVVPFSARAAVKRTLKDAGLI